MVIHWKTVRTANRMLSNCVMPSLGPIQVSLQSYFSGHFLTPHANASSDESTVSLSTSMKHKCHGAHLLKHKHNDPRYSSTAAFFIYCPPAPQSGNWKFALKCRRQCASGGQMRTGVKVEFYHKIQMWRYGPVQAPKLDPHFHSNKIKQQC